MVVVISVDVMTGLNGEGEGVVEYSIAMTHKFEFEGNEGLKICLFVVPFRGWSTFFCCLFVKWSGRYPNHYNLDVERDRACN